MDLTDYQAGRNGNLTPPGGDWSDYHRGVGDQQHWQANNDAVRHRSSGRFSIGTLAPEIGFMWWLSVIWGALKLIAVVWIAYKLFFA